MKNGATVFTVAPFSVSNHATMFGVTRQVDSPLPNRSYS